MTKKGRPRRSAPDLCAGPTAGRPVYMVRQMDIILSNSSGKPIYEQITDQVKEQIMTGALAAGDALPSMRLLAKELRISVITTKRAYDGAGAGRGFLRTSPAKAALWPPRTGSCCGRPSCAGWRTSHPGGGRGPERRYPLRGITGTSQPTVSR